MGVIPVVGNLPSAQEAIEDRDACIKREDGASAADAPTVSDNWAKSIDDIFG